MKPIIIVILAVQIGGLIAAAATIVFKRRSGASRRPIWSSLAVSMVVIAATSYNIATAHTDAPGADIVQLGGGIILGMGVAMALMAIRERRGLDQA